MPFSTNSWASLLPELGAMRLRFIVAHCDASSTAAEHLSWVYRDVSSCLFSQYDRVHPFDSVFAPPGFLAPHE